MVSHERVAIVHVNQGGLDHLDFRKPEMEVDFNHENPCKADFSVLWEAVQT